VSALFRPEALEARRRGRPGEVSLAALPGTWTLAAFALVSVALLLAFLARAEYTRRSRVAGQLVPDRGLATLAAPEAGTVLRTFAAEGDVVRRGAPLAVIATSRGTPADGDTTAALLAHIEERREAAIARFASTRQQLAAQAEGAAAQLAAARREREQVESSLELARERRRLAESLLGELRRLADGQFVSRLEVTRQEQAMLELAAAERDLERLATALERDRLALEQRQREVGMQRAALDAEEEAELALLAEERLRVAAAGEVLVSAPLDGTVASALAEPGQAVRAGQALATLVPAGSRLQAELIVPSRAIGFLEPGDRVLLRYRAFPHQKFGHHRGTVAAVSQSALDAGALAALTGAPSAEPAYRVLVDLERQFVEAYGLRRPLRPGMRVEADLMGERRRLYEWLLEPLYSVAGRL
jgi:membrane fusion protein